MNPEVRALWSEALRSGRFVQGSSALATIDGASETVRHCCLGVLCELAVEAGVAVRVESDSYYGYRGSDQRFPVFKFPPVVVADWAGLSSVNPSVEVPNGVVDADDYVDDSRVLLITLNDDVKMPFERIADLVDRL
jgi:hypothetical protein